MLGRFCQPAQEEQAAGSDLAPKTTAELAQNAFREKRGTADPDEQRIVDLLCSQGYILTKGAQFGADWLVYQGSPETHHAAACLRIVDPSHPIDPVLLAGFCRCSFSARKDVLLASWDRQLNAPHFLTLRPKVGIPEKQPTTSLQHRRAHFSPGELMLAVPVVPSSLGLPHRYEQNGLQQISDLCHEGAISEDITWL